MSGRRSLRRITIGLPVFLIRGYQRLLSPVLPSLCRYEPSCSEYAVEALENRGLIVGSAYALWRILRCNPLGRGGLDLPPSPRPGP